MILWSDTDGSEETCQLWVRFSTNGEPNVISSTSFRFLVTKVGVLPMLNMERFSPRMNSRSESPLLLLLVLPHTSLCALASQPISSGIFLTLQYCTSRVSSDGGASRSPAKYADAMTISRGLL